MRLHEKFFPFSKRNSFQWKSLDMQMLDFETAQCCSMFFKAVLVFFSPMFFEQPRTKQSSNKVAWLQVALCPSWDRGMMNEWMNEWNTIRYNAMKWISKEHRQTCSLCFWRWSSCVRGWTWFDSWHTVPMVVGSLRQQPASHKVGPHWLLRSISTLSSNLCSYQPQLVVYLELSNNGWTCSLHHRSMHCFYLAGSFMWTTSRCFNTQWKRMSWWFAKYLFCMH